MVVKKGQKLKKYKFLMVVTIWEWTKPILCSKWGHFDRAKTIFRILLASWPFYTVWKGFRSFDTENLGSVGQRTAKLLVIKLWEWFDLGRTRIWAEGDCTDCTLFGCKGWRVCKHKVWWLVTLQPFNLQTPNFQH